MALLNSVCGTFENLVIKSVPKCTKLNSNALLGSIISGSEQYIKQYSEYIAKTEITLNCLLFCYMHHKALINITFDWL